MSVPTQSCQDESRPTKLGFEDVPLLGLGLGLVSFLPFASLALRTTFLTPPSGGWGGPITHQFQTNCHVPIHRAPELLQC